MNKKLAVVFGALGLVLATTVSTSAATPTTLVVNGSFEEPVLVGTWGLFATIPGWAPTGSCLIEVQRATAFHGDSHSGNQHVELDSNCSATIYQDVPTVPGRVYQLSVFFSARPNVPVAFAGPDDNQLQISWGDVVAGDVEVADGTGATNTAWREVTRTVVGGEGPTTRLALTDAGISNTWGTLVDTVTVTQVPVGGCPAPSSGFALAELLSDERLVEADAARDVNNDGFVCVKTDMGNGKGKGNTGRYINVIDNEVSR